MTGDAVHRSLRKCRSGRLADTNSPEEYNLQSKWVILCTVNSVQATAIRNPEKETYHGKCKPRNSFRWVCTHMLTRIACTDLKKCDNGPLGSGHKILSAQKYPGAQALLYLAIVLFTAPYITTVLYTHVYTYNTFSYKWLIAALYHKLLQHRLAPETLPAKYLLAPTQPCFVSVKGVKAIQRDKL